MQKILGIMGSPRREGNTSVLLNEFVRGAKAANNEVDVITLNEKKISPCLGCYACKKDGICKIKDDFTEIYKKLETCDKLVIATPIFFSAMPSQLKAVIDRCHSFYMRKYKLKKPITKGCSPKRPAYLLAVAGSKNTKILTATLLILKYFLDALDMKLIKTLAYNNINSQDEIFKYPDILHESYNLGFSI